MIDLQQIVLTDHPTEGECRVAADAARENALACQNEANRYFTLSTDLALRAERIKTGLEGSVE